MKALNKMRRFHLYHKWLLVKQVHPLLCIPVIHQEILPDECIPAVTLVQVQSFIKTSSQFYIKGKVLFEKVSYGHLVIYISCMSMPYIPAIQLKGEIR